MEKYFTFIDNKNTSSHLSDALIAVMLSKKHNKNTKEYIIENMNYKHNDVYLNWLLLFIDNIYKHGYTVTKYEYIKREFPYKEIPDFLIDFEAIKL
jgi:hypothetical protein